MTDRKRKDPEDDGVVYLEDSGADDLAAALLEAERAVSAVEERTGKVEHGLAVAGEEEPPEGLPPAVAVTALEAEVAVERERAVRAEEEAGRLREALVRKAADFDNLKRRSEREKAEYFKYALAEAFRDLLGVLDNFERAMAHAPASGADEFRTGVEMIGRQLAEVLRKYGLAEVPADGQPFDPSVHEAVMRREVADVPPGTVFEVFQKGYVLGERLLRPAMVSVAAAPAAPPAEA